MSILDSFFNKGFKASKCNTLLKLTIPRIKLLRNRRESHIKQMRRDIAKLLESGQEATARIRVEHIIREENMMAAQEILELFSELIAARVPIIEAQRECPLDLKEAISSVCFAAPRCADLPELQQVQLLFASKYGREFVLAATGLTPDCGVNRQLIELLSVRAPAPETKLKLLKEIAEEHGLDWNPDATESEFFKQPEDLLNGPTQFMSGSVLPLPVEKKDEATYSTPDQSPTEQSDDEDIETLDFPEIPKMPIRPKSTPIPATAPPIADTPHTESDEEFPSNFGAKNNPLPMEDLENKQFLPFISHPSLLSSTSHYEVHDKVDSDLKDYPPQSLPYTSDHTVEKKSPQLLARTKSEGSIDLQDVLAAAQAAAESAERSAAAARSLASLAQIRISELVKKRKEPDFETSHENENPFVKEHFNEPEVTEKRQLDHLDSTGSYDNITSYSPEPYFQEQNWKTEASFDMSKSDDGSGHHHPEKQPSMDEDPFLSYPNLFSSHGSNHGSGTH